MNNNCHHFKSTFHDTNSSGEYYPNNKINIIIICLYIFLSIIFLLTNQKIHIHEDNYKVRGQLFGNVVC